MIVLVKDAEKTQGFFGACIVSYIYIYIDKSGLGGVLAYAKPDSALSQSIITDNPNPT